MSRIAAKFGIVFLYVIKSDIPPGGCFTFDELELLVRHFNLPPAPYPHLWSVERYEQLWLYVESLVDEPVEWLIAFYVDATLQIQSIDTVEVGDSCSVDVPQARILARAITLGASGIMLVHNHPSGECTPSRQDIRLTKQMVAGADAIGIPLLDHFVIARDGMRRIVFDGGQTRFKPGRGFMPDPNSR